MQASDFYMISGLRWTHRLYNVHGNSSPFPSHFVKWGSCSSVCGASPPAFGRKYPVICKANQRYLHIYFENPYLRSFFYLRDICSNFFFFFKQPATKHYVKVVIYEMETSFLSVIRKCLKKTVISRKSNCLDVKNIGA